MGILLRRALPAILALLSLAGIASADTTLQQIQLGQVNVNTIVQVDGVVITAVGRFGFFVQEPDPDPQWGRQYSGCWIYTNTQPTLHDGDLVNVRGKYYEYYGQSEIDVFCADCQGQVTKVGIAPVPDPVPVTIPEVNDTGAYAAAYDGVLVRVDRDDNTLIAQATHDNPSYTPWMLKRGVGQDSLYMSRWSAFPGGDFNYDIPAVGQAITFAAGVMVYYHNHWKLAPRSCQVDLGMPCPLNLSGAYSIATNPANQIGLEFGVAVSQQSAEDITHYELASGWEVASAVRDPNDHKRVYLTTDDLGDGNQEQVLVHGLVSEDGVAMVGVQNAAFRTGFTPISQIQYVSDPLANDSSPLLNEVVTVHGRVTALNGPNYYFLQDEDGGPWTGLSIYVARQSSIRVKDIVTVAGAVREYGSPHGITELGYQLGVDWFRPQSGWVDPVVQEVTTNQIRFRDPGQTFGYSAEQYENCLVHVTSARLDSLAGRAGPYFREWLMYQQGRPDTAQMAVSKVNGTKSYSGCIGDIVNLTGIFEQDFGTYWVCPRSDRGYDIQVVYDNPACAPSGVEEAQALLGPNLHGAPNPFNPKTSIRFQIPSDETVGLIIVDPAGRIVRTLLQQAPMKAGLQQIGWDGKDDAGRPVGTGAYFARLQTAKGTVATKLVLLK